MSTEINDNYFNRIMNFLKRNQDTWFNDADKDKDGYIINSEFSNYLLNNKDFAWDGLADKQKKDLIDNFWDTFDVNTSASKIDGTNLRNINALDDDEKNELNGKINDHDYTDEIHVTDKIPDSMVAGEIDEYDFNVYMLKADENGTRVEMNALTFTATPSDNVTVDGTTGKIKITAPDEPQQLEVSVDIMYDNNVVYTYTKQISIKEQPVPVSDVPVSEPEEYDATLEGKNEIDPQDNEVETYTLSATVNGVAIDDVDGETVEYGFSYGDITVDDLSNMGITLTQTGNELKVDATNYNGTTNLTITITGSVIKDGQVVKTASKEITIKAVEQKEPEAPTAKSVVTPDYSWYNSTPIDPDFGSYISLPVPAVLLSDGTYAQPGTYQYEYFVGGFVANSVIVYNDMYPSVWISNSLMWGSDTNYGTEDIPISVNVTYGSTTLQAHYTLTVNTSQLQYHDY